MNKYLPKIVIFTPTFRIRRGKVVQVPQEWVGHVLYDQTKNKRKSKRTKKHK